MLRRKWFLTIAVLAALALAGTACRPNPQPEGLTPVPTLAPAATLTLVPAIGEAPGGGEAPPGGQAIAAAGAGDYILHCTPCHGNRGEGVDAPPLRNSQFVQTGGDQALYDTVADGRPGTEMPGWLQANGGPLNQLEIQNTVAYLHTMQGVDPNTPISPEAGGPGAAASMSGDAEQGRPDFGRFCAFCHGPEGVQGLPNPGSTDGSVPVLNPIDPEIASSDPGTFATNVDLYLQHGSLPEGSDPLLLMPPFGSREILSQEQIAGLIAYVLQLNGTSP